VFVGIATLLVIVLVVVVATRDRTDRPAPSAGPTRPTTDVAQDPSFGTETSVIGAPPATSAGPSSTTAAGQKPTTVGERGRDETAVPFRTPVRCPASGSPTTGAFPGADERDGYRWVTVGELSGRCDLQSRPFRITNADTRLVFRSDADQLAIFLLDPRELGSLAGFAQTTCAGPCAGSMVLIDKDIDAVLRIQAGDAPWSVRVEQYRRG